MNHTTNPQAACPNCSHPHHLPGTECQTPVHHGPNRWHLCLCLARPGAALSCPPQMTCQGGTLGYADVWYLQHGHTLLGEDGTIAPAVFETGVASVGFPSGPDISPPPSAVVSADRATLRAAVAEVLRPHASLGGTPPRYELPFFDGSTPSLPRISGWRPLDDVADAVLAVLPTPADRATLLREAADVAREEAHRLETGNHDARAARGARSVAYLLRRMAIEADANRVAAEEQPAETHSCSNCEGVDPDTCWTNPNRPPEQCPRSEFDGYGLQCQKPAGHNLCTFEEQPTTERPVVGEQPDTQETPFVPHCRELAE